MINTIFAVVLGAIALYAIVAAFRSAGRARMAWALVVIAAIVQAWNLLSAYNMLLSIITTIAILVGFFLARRGVPTPP